MAMAAKQLKIICLSKEVIKSVYAYIRVYTAYMEFDESMVVSVQKDKFLSNRNNKLRLIEMMRKYILLDSQTVTTIGDGDPAIVKCAVEVCLANIYFLLM